MNEDNRILYDIGNYKYTVSDVSKIYQDCKADIDNCDTNNLQFLYDSFHVKQNNKFVWSLSDIIMNFSETIAVIAKSGDIENIKKEVRKCRRKFYYWGDLPKYIYFINENLDCLLYTSDAADDGYSVDLGGRRIIKKIFFKQKTAYEISEGLVGSEMCIRDRFSHRLLHLLLTDILA